MMKPLRSILQDHMARHLTVYQQTMLRDDALVFPNDPIEMVPVAGTLVPFAFLGSGTQVEDRITYLLGHAVVPPVKPVMSRRVALPGGSERRIQVYAPAEGLAVRFWALDLVNGLAVAEAYGAVKNATWVPSTAEPYDEEVRLFNNGEEAAVRAATRALIETANVSAPGRQVLDDFLGEAAAIGSRAFAASERADLHRLIRPVQDHVRGEEVLLSRRGSAVVVRRGRRKSGATPVACPPDREDG
jgi:hypothetical protein